MSQGKSFMIRFANMEGKPLENIQEFYKNLPVEHLTANAVEREEILKDLDKIYKKTPNTPRKEQASISPYIKSMFEENATISKENILNSANIKPEYKPYFRFVKNVRYNIKEPQYQILYIYKQLIPFDIDMQIKSEGIGKLLELKRNFRDKYNELNKLTSILTNKDISDYDALYEFIINYTDIPKQLGGRRKSHTRSSRNRRHNQSKTKRNLRK